MPPPNGPYPSPLMASLKDFITPQMLSSRPPDRCPSCAKHLTRHDEMHKKCFSAMCTQVENLLTATPRIGVVESLAANGVSSQCLL